MNKLIHSHDDYFEDERTNEFFKLNKTQSGISLYMNDDYNMCFICDRHLNILHEIVIAKGGNLPQMGYLD